MREPSQTLVLLVETEHSHRLTLASALEGGELHVSRVTTGDEAARVLGELKPDLIIIRGDPPDISQLDLCRRTKSDPLTSEIPVLQVAKEFASSAARAAALENGADGCLAEPADPCELMAHIRRLMTVRRSAEALRRFEFLAEHSRDIILFMRRHDGAILEANKAAVDAYGYSHAELLSMTVHQLRGPGTHQMTSAQMAQADSAGILFETVHRRRDGSTFPVEVSSQGATIGGARTLISVIRDITERKQVENTLRVTQERLASLNSELERRVEERTARLQELVVELESFSYSMAHDMRAPLRSMHSFAQILAQDYRDKLDPQAEDYLRRIIGSAARLDLMIRDVLNYTRIVTQGLPLEAVNLESLVREILESYPTFQKPQAEIHITGALPPVLANVSALTQCVSNLLDNAVKFVPPGVVPRVVIRADCNEKTVRLWFEDNGIGIPEGWQDRIFGIFEQVHGTAAYGGTGIGLTVVRKSVERMGGSVGVLSNPGGGSRFWIELPRQV